MIVSIRCPDFVAARKWLRRAHPGIDVRIEGRTVATRFDGRGNRVAIRQYRVFGTVSAPPMVAPPPSITPVYG